MKKLYILSILLFVATGNLFSQDLDKNVEQRLKEFFGNYTCTSANIGKAKLDSFYVDYDHKKLSVYASEAFAYQPFLPEIVDNIYKQLENMLPGPVCFFETIVYAHQKPIEDLIPNIYRKKKKDKSRLLRNINYEGEPWVKNASRPYEISRGLQNRHIALWQSHGKYYSTDKDRWLWQRPRLFCTTEDLYTQSYIIPYVIPMLENAGANVFTPRERDTQRNEVIVDNDNLRSASLYIENKSRKSKWNTSDIKGFAQKKQIYRDNENPFTTGTFRYAKTESKKNKAFAEWVPSIPEEGKYAVYVSYQSLPNSVNDAKYLVFHKGGVTTFMVNQQIGGGTWVYLGTFEFDKGTNDYGMVVLSNESKQSGVVCADAVRFGGGMGNIARGKMNSYVVTTSGLPRYLEGARYSAQWAGMPYSVYGGREGDNDYADDINSRSNMINYLSGGSVYNPRNKGLGVPFEMSMGVHSDAGFSREDEIVGTLGIYTTDFKEGKLNSGISRYASRDLVDIMLTQVKADIQSRYDVSWVRRSMWDRNYSETRLPGVPSMILELLSHQNFADMKLGYDPNFRFTVGRAIYKSILRFVTSQHDEEFIVQPLPVSNFAISLGKKKNTLQLSWKAEEDPIEPSAKVHEYIVYTRIGHGGFDNGVLTNKPFYTMKIEPGLVYSFKVTAVNKGGESFPSEILSAYKAKKERGRILIVNGFDRISGPATINTPDSAGFDLEKDPGVPYLNTISMAGAQTGFLRKNAGKEDKGGLGYSGDELEGKRIAGNSFDYPFIHGKAIQAVGGFSFVSCSDEAVENGLVSLEDYPVVDFILGLEKNNDADTHARNVYYKTFSSPIKRMITSYCQSGGNILVSGSYVGSDMSNSIADREFTENILKYRFEKSIRDSYSGLIKGLGRTFVIPRALNETTYAVVAPDCVTPVAPAFSSFVYADGNNSAGTAFKGNYRTFVMGFPFESIDTEENRANIMASILSFFTK